MIRLLLALLLLVATSPLAAHVYWIIPGDLVVGEQGTTITLRLTLGQTVALLPGQWRQVAPDQAGGATVAFTPFSGLHRRRDLDAQWARISAALSAGIRIEGHPPGTVAYLPDLLGEPVDPDLALPADIRVVIAWSGAPGVVQARCRLYQDQPVLVTVDLVVHGVPGRDRLQITGEGFLPFEALPLLPGSSATSATAANVVSSGPGRWQTLGHMLVQGFLHIVPEGLDHVLFVLGLFLAVRSWRPLLIQITAFTVAHSLTLGLAVCEVIRVPSRPVEILIALSIVAVGIENLRRGEPARWRWVLVFAFGLIHGLGFAGAMADIDWARDHLGQILLGFNLGVELGQLTVVAAAAMLVAWFWQRSWYRSAVVIPGSLTIAAIALWWTVERCLG